MIDFAKKFSDEIIKEFSIFQVKDGSLERFNPDNDDEISGKLTLKIRVNLDELVVGTNDSLSIIENCNGDVSLLIAIHCPYTDFVDSSKPLKLKLGFFEYEFDLYIPQGTLKNSFTLNASIFYSGTEIIGKNEYQYWPSISLLALGNKWFKTWSFETFKLPMFKVAKFNGSGLRLVTLNFDNVIDQLHLNFEEIDYVVLIDLKCLGKDFENDNYVISCVIYEYLEYLFFKPDLAENLILNFYDENTLGKNMFNLMESYFIFKFKNKEMCNLENVNSLRMNKLEFKNQIFNYIENVVK